MIGNAVTLAALTSAGFFLIYKKLPRRAKRLIVKYSLVSDIVALLLTYLIFGGTVTALIAAALVSIITSILLHIANHPEDFTWLNDTIKSAKTVLEEGKELLRKMNTKYVDMKTSTN